MNLTISVLGCEVFSISTETQASDDKGDAVSMPVGFAMQDRDFRWERGVELS